MAASLYCLWNECNRPTRLSFCLAVLTTALAMFVKIPCAFLLMPALAALAWNRYGLKGAMLNPRVWLLVLGTSLPSLWYYGTGLFVSGTLRYQVDVQWQPMMYLQADYWTGWARMAIMTVGIPGAVLGGMGILFFRLRSARALIVGLWGGYVAYGLTFTNGISSHQYYQMPLILILSISLGPSALAMLRRWMRIPRSLRYGAGILVLAFLAVALSIAVCPPDSGVKRVISSRFRGYMERGLDLCGTNIPGIRLWGDRRTETISIAAHIGQMLQHSDRVVLLGYAMPAVLKYHSLISPHVWPDRKRVELIQEGVVFPPVEEEFRQRFQSIMPEYFLAWPEDRLQYQPDLVQYLERRYPVLERKDGYVIYDLRTVRDANSVP